MTGLTNRQKKIKAKKIMDYLDKVFPNVECELDFSNNLELIIAVLLSAQCKDEYVNRATVGLFENYKTIDDYADAKVEDIEKYIKTLGLYKAKSKKQTVLYGETLFVNGIAVVEFENDTNTSN